MARRRVNAFGDLARGHALLLDGRRDARRRVRQFADSAGDRGNLLHRSLWSLPGWRLPAGRCRRWRARSGWRASSPPRRPPRNPLPASPARAASIVALSARRLVCPAIAEMVPTTEPMRSAASFSVPMTCPGCASVSADRRLRHAEAVGGLLADLLDRSGQFFRRGDGRVHAARRFCRGRRRGSHAGERRVSRCPERRACRGQRSRGFLDRVDHVADGAVEVRYRRVDRRRAGPIPPARPPADAGSWRSRRRS